MSDYLKEFPHIWKLLRYFNQDWVAMYDWKGKKPSFQPIIRYFKMHNGLDVTEQLIVEIERILQLPLSDDEFDTVMVEELFCEYTPRSQALNKRQFMESSLEILKESIEKTKLEFIPAFIG